MLTSRFLAPVAVTFVLALRANADSAETHTIKFINNCGYGYPKLMYNGQDVLNGSDTYTSTGTYSGIAYLQTGPCNTNGENCVLLETTLINPTCAGCGSSTDISLIPPHAYNVETSFAYYNGCDGQGQTCSGPNCTSSAFFASNDNFVQVECQITNVDLLVAFCADASQLLGATSGGAPPTSSLPTPSGTPSTPGSVPPPTGTPSGNNDLVSGGEPGTTTPPSSPSSPPSFTPSTTPATTPTPPATPTGANPSDPCDEPGTTPPSTPTLPATPSGANPSDPCDETGEPSSPPSPTMPTPPVTPTTPSGANPSDPCYEIGEPSSPPAPITPTQTPSQPTLPTTPPSFPTVSGRRCRPRPTGPSASGSAPTSPAYTPTPPPSSPPSFTPSATPVTTPPAGTGTPDPCDDSNDTGMPSPSQPPVRRRHHRRANRFHN